MQTLSDTQHNARGLRWIVVGRAARTAACATDSDAATTTAAARAKPEETRYWYYALLGFGLNRYRAGSGQPPSGCSAESLCIGPDRPRPARSVAPSTTSIAANDRVIEAA